MPRWTTTEKLGVVGVLLILIPTFIAWIVLMVKLTGYLIHNT